MMKMSITAGVLATVVVATVFVTATCESGSTGPGNSGGPVYRVTVAPSTAVLPPGASKQFTATAFDQSGDALTGVSFNWSTSQATVATTTATGLVTAVASGNATITASAAGKSGQTVVSVLAGPPAGAVIDVYPSVTFQTMRGWEATAQMGQVSCDPQAFAAYQGPLLDRVANELGVNRIRLEVRSGQENPVDYWSERWITKTIDDAAYTPHLYEIINDNSDPFTTNPAGFQLSQTDVTVDRVINPLRDRLQARGEHLYVTLTYVDFKSSTFEHSSNPNEYAEFILVLFQHLQSRYGWVPDGVEMILEPDNTSNWRPATIGPAIVATGDRLAAAGFHPDFIAPSNTNASSAVSYFDALMQIPRVSDYLTDLSYHRYSGVSDATIAAIGARTQAGGMRSGMMEHIGSGYEDLHQDLESGMVSEWEQYTLAACNTSDPGGRYYLMDVTNPQQPAISLASRSKYLRQYFMFVRMGAVRIGAASGDSRFDPLAFRNTNGKFVVIVKASSGGSFEVRDLPAGTYGLMYTTPSAFGVNLADVTIGTGDAVPASIPAAGVITIYRR